MVTVVNTRIGKGTLNARILDGDGDPLVSNSCQTNPDGRDVTHPHRQGISLHTLRTERHPFVPDDTGLNTRGELITRRSNSSPIASDRLFSASGLDFGLRVGPVGRLVVRDIWFKSRPRYEENPWNTYIPEGFLASRGWLFLVLYRVFYGPTRC